MGETMKPFRCLKCGITFGLTDGFVLRCGEFAIFTLKVTPTCANCGEHRVWRPVGKRDIVVQQEDQPTCESECDSTCVCDEEKP